MEFVGKTIGFLGMLVTLVGLWSVAGGLRVVVSGRIDERRKSANSLRVGLLILVIGLLLVIAGAWVAQWSLLG